MAISLSEYSIYIAIYQMQCKSYDMELRQWTTEHCTVSSNLMASNFDSLHCVIAIQSVTYYSH